jgi:hypothetical protein
MASIFEGLERMLGRRYTAVAVLIAAAFVRVPSARAQGDANGNSVSGTIELASGAAPLETPERNRGFLERARNPFKSPQPLDPRGEMVVVLTGGVALPADTEPPRTAVNYEIRGETFEVLLLPVVAGAEVKIRNDKKTSKAARRLYSPGSADLIESGVLKPGGVRSLKKVSKPYQLLELRDRDSAHLYGRILTLPHRYFSLVSEAGKFEISNVPTGAWNVQIWYRNGWLKMSDVQVEVRAGAALKRKIELPPQLSVRPPKN